MSATLTAPLDTQQTDTRRLTAPTPSLPTTRPHRDDAPKGGGHPPSPRRTKPGPHSNSDPVRVSAVPGGLAEPTVNTLEVGMGTRGPVPKRDAERRRRNKPSTPAKTGAAGAKFPQPRALAGWHPSMTRWYKSLAESGQAQFFEASDWEGARFVATHGTHLINEGLTAPGFTALLSAMNDLLTTEGARRRASVELTKAKPGEGVGKPAPVAVMDDYRQALGG